jgi:aspartyl protease family protein
VGGVVALLLAGRSPQTAPKPAAPDPFAGEPPVIRALKSQLAEAPCNARAALKLAEALIDADRHNDVVAVGGQWHAKCGPHVELDWKVFHAYKQLGQWEQALPVVSTIIANDPEDSDYWWWRAEVQEQLERDQAALADYRQSLANSDNYEGGAFAAGRIARPARRAGRSCEALSALEFFGDELGGTLRASEKNLIFSIAREDQCRERVQGKRARLPLGTASRPQVLTAQIGSATGRFLVGSHTGTTTVTRALAERAGLASGTTTVETLAAGRIRSGTLTTADRVTAAGVGAQKVDVLVVDDLGPGIDGVLGLNFLWKFKMSEHETRVDLSPRG